MNKVLSTLIGIAMVAGLIVSSGCDIKPEQVKVIAQNAGLFSAVSWIAYDNPTVEAKNAVVSIMGAIETSAADVEAGATYTETIYPEIAKIVDKDVEEQYRPICKAGALSLLSGIDILFATHPEWKEDQDLAIQVINAFIMGAKNGLSLSEDDSVIKAANTMADERAKLYTKKTKKAKRGLLRRK